jgi:hypothetical protein
MAAFSRLERRRRFLHDSVDQDGRCHYCERPVGHDTGSVDHVVPQAVGGLDLAENYVLSCRWCNSSKASWVVDCFCRKCARARAQCGPIQGSPHYPAYLRRLAATMPLDALVRLSRLNEAAYELEAERRAVLASLPPLELAPSAPVVLRKVVGPDITIPAWAWLGQYDDQASP